MSERLFSSPESNERPCSRAPVRPNNTTHSCCAEGGVAEAVMAGTEREHGEAVEGLTNPKHTADESGVHRESPDAPRDVTTALYDSSQRQREQH